MNHSRALLITVILLISACSEGNRQAGVEVASENAVKSTVVVTSNYPLHFFATRIAAGVEAAPAIMFPDIDGDPAYWIPGSEQILLLQSADVVILNGAGAESWLNLITLDQRRLFDTSADIADRYIALEDSVQHQHGPAGEHSHQGYAFTTWLDPQLAIAQAQAIAKVLIQLSPTNEVQFRDNMANLEQELLELDTRLADVFAQLGGQPIVFSHPVYQYLQRRYGINAMSVHWEPDVEPTTSAWIDLQRLLASHPASIVIWEDEPLPSTAQRLSDTGIKSVAFRTAANKPNNGDYLSVMQENVKQFDSMLQD